MTFDRAGADKNSPRWRRPRLGARWPGLVHRLAPPGDTPVHRPTLITVARLRSNGLGRDRGARAVYMPSDGSLICRTCVDNDGVRRAALSTHDAGEQAVVLYGGWVRRTAFVDCVVHRFRLPGPFPHEIQRAR